MFNIFKTKLLGDISTIKSSKRIFESDYVEKGIPFIRGQEISDKNIGKTKKYECYISNKKYSELKEKYGVPKEGDILITAVGTIGNLYFVENKEQFYFKDGNIIQFTNYSKEVYPKYLYYFMQSYFFRKQIENRLIGAVQKALTMVMLSKIEVNLPEIQDQIKIVDILEKIDAKITINEKINDNLQQLAETIYNYWFVQFDFPDENGRPYKSSGGQMVWNNTLNRSIPLNWNVFDLNSICSFSNGINYDKNEIGNKDYRIVNVRNISSSSVIINSYDLDYITLKQSQADKYLINEDNILIARSGVPGSTRLLLDIEYPTIYCGFIICCTPQIKEQKLYITYHLKQFEGSNVTKTGGSIMQNVSQETLKALKLCIPPKELLTKYNDKINSIYRCIEKNLSEINHLKSLRDYLLPLLMNGQITIE